MVQPQVARRELRSILSGAEYNRSYEVQGQTWAERAWSAVGKAIARFLSMLAEGVGGVGGTLSIILACAVVVGFLALVYLIVAKLARRIPYAGPDDAAPEAFQLLSARPLIKEARKLAQAGDYRAAFRCAYLASISHLDESKALRFERSRTNWEYMRELQSGGHQTPYDALRPLTMDFDRKFYGGEACTIADFERAAQAYELVAGGTAA